MVRNPLKQLAETGLYSPELEHDSCGVGMVANIKGGKSHSIIEESLQVLKNLGHRGACGCDPDTGDGAGILIQMPHAFFKKECARIGIELPNEQAYGVGMVFLPPDDEARRVSEALIEEVVHAEGLVLLGWRDVPVNPPALGRDAREVQPVIRQIFVKGGASINGADELDRKLYVARKSIEHRLLETDINDDQADYFYLCSFSCTTIVYKGLLMADQVDGFHQDMKDEDLVSAFALVHSRFSTNTLGHWKLAHPYRFLAHNGEINTLRGNVNWMA